MSSSISCSFLHVKRKGNRLAHALCCRAVSSADTDEWLEDLPQDLDDVFSLIFSNKVSLPFSQKKKKKRIKVQGIGEN